MEKVPLQVGVPGPIQAIMRLIAGFSRLKEGTLGKLFVLSTALLVAAAIVTGCYARRTARNVGFGISHMLFLGTFDLPYWAEAFRSDKGRLPKDYPELKRFIARSDPGIQLKAYERVDFTLLPTGERHADCYWLAQSVTNHELHLGKTGPISVVLAEQTLSPSVFPSYLAKRCSGLRTCSTFPSWSMRHFSKDACMRGTR
jgi:hypothetical protein